MRTYEFTDRTITVGRHTLHRIRATEDSSLGYFRKGDLGGFVESYKNLCENAWVGENAQVYGNAAIHGEANVSDNAIVTANAELFGHASISGRARISDNAHIYERAWVSGNALVFSEARVFGNARVLGNANVHGNSKIFEHACIGGCSSIFGNACVLGDAFVSDESCIQGDAVITKISDYIVFKNWWSSGRYFTWTRSNNKLSVGCFHGTGEELIKKAYADSEVSGREYEKCVKYAEGILNENKQ